MGIFEVVERDLQGRDTVLSSHWTQAEAAAAAHEERRVRGDGAGRRRQSLWLFDLV